MCLACGLRVLFCCASVRAGSCLLSRPASWTSQSVRHSFAGSYTEHCLGVSVAHLVAPALTLESTKTCLPCILVVQSFAVQLKEEPTEDEVLEASQHPNGRA